MHVLILFLISVTAYATSRISNRFPRFQAANFGQMMDGRQLNGSVIKEIEVKSESSCRLECVNEERCKSYNFGGKKNKSERWKCQISDSDRFERPARANFIENKEFSCRGIKIFAMHFKWLWLPPRYTKKFEKKTINGKKWCDKIAELHPGKFRRVFAQCWRARHRIVFAEMIFLFKVTKSRQKAMSKIRIIVCCSKYYQNDFHYQAKAWRRDAHTLSRWCHI